MNKRIDTIIVDLTGVLFTIDQWQVFKLMGIKNVLCYLVTHFKNPFTETLKIATLIAQREKQSNLPLLLYKTYQMPSCLTKSHLGIITAQEAHKEFTQKLQQLVQEGLIKSKLEQRMMQQFIDVISDPEIRAHLITPNYALLNLILECKTIKRRFILSNLDMSTYGALRTHYPDMFALFEGSIISAEVGMVKPNSDIYEYLLTTYNLQPANCLFLDDQQENVETAQKLGITSILYTSTTTLKQELRQLMLIAKT
ncbi:MAG: HAD-IA family hydrolase [Candidatus Babeliales bacterium]